MPLTAEDSSQTFTHALTRVRSSIHRAVQGAAKTTPARLAISVFTLFIVLVAVLLYLPVSSSGPHTSITEAFFTSVSAVCVTGLVVVDTGTHWSTFGLFVLAAAMKIGGLGVLTLASLLSLTVSRRMGLSQRVVTASETKAQKLAEVGSVIRTIVITSTAFEVITAAILLPRLLVLGQGFWLALGHSSFYGISAFNNAGFVPEAAGFEQYAGDPFMTLPIALSVFVGSLGFPVILVVVRELKRPSLWTLHAKLTLSTTTVLLAFTCISIAILEWGNELTIGTMNLWQKLDVIFFMSVMPRSGGFALVDVNHLGEGTWLIMDAMMFVGGGSGSTAGGIKVTTVALLLLAIIAESRGDRDVEAFGRRIPAATVRQAVAVLFIGVTIVFAATLTLVSSTPYRLDLILFEVLSAFNTVGLSTGITADLPIHAQWTLIILMYVGRLGTMTLSAALALRERRRVIRYPEERPTVG